MSDDDDVHVSSGIVSRKGIGLCASWDLRSYKYVKKIFERIRRTRVDTFHDALLRVYNDQTVEKEFEPVAVDMSTNKVVNDGLVRIAELVTGTVGLNSGFGSSSGYFTHFACGSGSNAVSASDYQLQAEIARVGLADSGFQTAAGSIMRFGGFYPPSIASATINEGAVFDDPNAGIMLFRTVYPQGVTHVVNVDFYTLSHSIYQYSV